MAAHETLEDAFVLHRIPYRDTSLLVDFLGRSSGRVRAVARGARQIRSRQRSNLQPFQPLLVSFAGRGELQTLRQAEPAGASLQLQSARLFSGMYLNELLVRLLPYFQSCPDLYDHYRLALQQLHDGMAIEQVLRAFEYRLLAELGYGLDLHHEADSGAAIVAGQRYHFRAQQGLVAAGEIRANADDPVYQGEDILAIREFDLDSPAVARAAKQLFRAALQVHLGSRPLHSRRLFPGARQR